MTVAFALLTLAAILGAFVLYLLLDWALRIWRVHREQEAMRVRNEKLRKWGMKPFDNQDLR